MVKNRNYEKKYKFDDTFKRRDRVNKIDTV